MPTQIKYLFLLSSFICFMSACYLLWQRQAPINAPSEINYDTDTILPLQIIFPSQNLSLPIFPVDKEGEHLPTIDNGICFLKNSSLPNQSGIGLYYGHNWLSLLGKLKQVKLGQTIIIKLSNHQEYQYLIDQIAIINPDDQFLPESNSDSRLVIYTCAGIFDEKRLLVSAKISSLPE
jgi:LPXTG-site transpeptidase (sortase) family protein